MYMAKRFLTVKSVALTFTSLSFQNPLNPGKTCPGPSGNLTEYRIDIRSGSFLYSEEVNVSMCTAGKCSHTFEPSTNLLNGRLPSGYDSVSVVAKNMVGVGAARTCTTLHISEILQPTLINIHESNL